MSKVKADKTEVQAKTQQPASKKKKNAKKKKKPWFEKKDSSGDQRKDKTQQIQPPKDAQQFSANWKMLQEMLKSTQPEKKQPVTLKHLNGDKSVTGENVSKDIFKTNSEARQTDTRRVKHKVVSNGDVPKDSGLHPKVPAVVATGQSTGPKRKRDGGKSKSDPEAKKMKPAFEKSKPTEEDLWFDDVDPDDIEATVGTEAAEIMRKKQGIQKSNDAERTLVKEHAFEGFTRAVAIDCEMVGVGPDGQESILARVSLVNQFGKCIYDKYVKPTEKVTDYRTAVSGIRPSDIKDGEDVKIVQKEVADIMKDRILVGHAIHNDLKILLLDHPKKKIRDTQKYKPFKKIVKCGRPSLKHLCREILNVKVQQGEHSSVQDAQATMRLYTLVKKQWEADFKGRNKNKDSDIRRERKPKRIKNKGRNPMAS
ncbi:RNA exonuclease 4 [Betta splendens]|uniref:RNA exonuclease 4 n=1 Tax=Betta splendens TaxID=158456 RepID=A0A6P7L4Q0_BETSP|nr:RNA exonuclease 4 [Betta splendens]